MCLQNMRLKMMAISDLRSNGFNPASRTRSRTSPKYKLLRESIRQYGVLSPLQVSPDGLVIDGHRRLACAIELGLTEVPCVICSVNAQLAWSQAVFTQQGVNGRQVIEASAQGLDPVYMPSHVAAVVVDLQESAGPELYQEMAENGIGTGVRNALNRVCRYTGDNSPEWRRLVLRWLVRHKMQFEIRKAIDSDPLNEDGTRERMRAAINRDGPLRATWS